MKMVGGTGPGPLLNTDLSTWPSGIQWKCVLNVSLTLGYFQFLAIISNIAMSILAQHSEGPVTIALAEFLEME